jgi:GNAT superfamily N-acetyltransferase
MADEQAFQDTGGDAQGVGASERLSPLYNIVRSYQLEGSYPGDTGAWPVSGLRVGCGWGSVLEADWPWTTSREAWPPPEPAGLDAKAKALRTHHYQRIRSARECCIMLGYLQAVSAAFEITGQWFEAENGLIQMARAEEPIVGSHCVALLGFSRLYFGFEIANSWGEKWGHRGYGLLPFEYFDRYLVSAWTSHGIGPLPDYYACEGIQTVSWGELDFLGNSLHGGDVIHGREVYDGTNDERIGWTFAVHRDGFLDVEELFVRPQYRGREHGTRLVEMLLELAAKLKRPLRLWIPFADWTPSNLPAVERVVDKLGLRLYHADVRWAAAMALDPAALPPPHPTEVERRET